MEDTEAIPVEEFNTSLPQASGHIPAEQFNQPATQQESDEAIPVEEFNQDSSAEETPLSSKLQELGTTAEGVAQGFAGPVATLAEKGLGKLGIPGFSDEDIVNRRETNPIAFGAGEAIGTAASFYTGQGEAGMLAKLVGGSEGANVLTRIGSGAIKMGIQSGLIQGGNEISKALLGQADPEAPVSTALAHMGAAGLFGLVTGGAFSALGEGAAAAASSKIANRANSWAAGFGVKSMPNAEGEMMAPLGMDAKSYLNGQKYFDDIMSGAAGKSLKVTAARVVGKIAAPIIAGIAHLPGGAMTGYGVEYGIEKGLEAGLPVAARKYLGPALYRMSSQGSIEEGLDAVINYCSGLARGESIMNRGVQSLFKAGGSSAIDSFTNSEARRKKLNDYIEAGGTDAKITQDAQQTEQAPQFAAGGEVSPISVGKPDPVARYFPEHNILLNAAKTRVSNYLNSIRPVTTATMRPYDRVHKDKTRDRQYDKTLDLANNPLLILNHIKRGDLVPRHVQDFKAMFPEMHGHLSKKITERIMQGKMKEETPPSYKTRQAMSLFLGADLDSSFLPQNIMAAQAVFAKQNAQKQAVAQNKIKDIGKNNWTAQQAREDRQNNS